ncbi:filamin repeat domain-containing protein [Ditylenchus destructor]|nr:filamin repeat domain-containing protein [Ditylenchus destructor]
MDESESVTPVRELAHDPSWKKIQQNTFTRWVNQHLKSIGSSINDLETDLCDGIQLIKLAEVLSGKRLARYNKQSTMRTQKLDNVSLVLSFFQNEENIKFVNIGSTDIVDQNMRLILGLIWTLILHYSISQPTLTTDNSTATSKDSTPRQRLMAWIKSRLAEIPDDVPVTNFTSDWNDGLALGALIDACVPGACSDWRSWSPDNALQNTLKAMKAAEDNLGIAGLISPEDLINPNVDEKSVMTYLSQFPKAKAQQRGRISGVDDSPIVGQSTEFFVDVDGPTLEPQLDVVDSQGNSVPASVEHNAVFPTRYDAKFVPQQPGRHKIRVVLVEKEDPVTGMQLKLDEVTVNAVPAPKLIGLDSPVDVAAQDALVWGRGICPESTCVGDELPVHIDNCPETVSVTVLTKEGLLVPVSRISASVSSKKTKKPQRQSFSYIPRSAGPFTVEVNTEGSKPGSPVTHLGQSPYKVNVGPRNTSSIRAIGPGLETGVAGQRSAFYVDTRGNTNLLEFSIEGPSKTEINCLDNGDGTAVVEYTPTTSGRYIVNVLNDGHHIKDSPFVVMVESDEDDHSDSQISTRPQSPVQIRASGLEDWNKSYVGDPFKFTLSKPTNSTGQHPELDVIVYDPDLRKVDGVKKYSTSAAYNFQFTPEKVGKHIVSVATKDGIAVDGWPIPVMVRPALDLSKLRVFGPGVGTDVLQNQGTSFTVDARTVGSDDVEVAGRDPEGLPFHMDLIGTEPGLFTAHYTAAKSGDHRIKVLVEKEPAFDIEVDVKAPKKIDNITNLTAQELPLTANAERKKKNSTSSSSSSSSDSSKSRGSAHNDRSSLNGIQLASDIPQTVVGHNASLHLKVPDNKAKSSLVATIRAPDGSEERLLVQPSKDDQYRVDFLPKQPGMHAISVQRNDKHVAGSPFQVPVGLLGSVDAHRAVASGSGLVTGQVDRVETFTVRADEVNAGELSVTIDGPSRANVVISNESKPDSSPGTDCRVDYSVTEPGLYEIDVKFNDAHIDGSPFRVFIKPKSSPDVSSHSSRNPTPISYNPPSATTFTNVDSYKNGVSHKEAQDQCRHTTQGPAVTLGAPLHTVNENVAPSMSGLPPSIASIYDGDARKVVAKGEGLNHFQPGVPASFTIDTANAGTNLLFVGVVTSRGPSDEVKVEHCGNGFYQVSYRIPESSKAMVFVKYGEAQITGSPFMVLPK